MSDKSLITNKKHAKACHNRWLKNLNRDAAKQDYKEKWSDEQCGGCRFYVPLIGAFIADWGACSNENSPCDGTVRLEHDGCDFYSEAANGWGIAIDEWFVASSKDAGPLY
jgi:hypothetical protein